MANYDSRYTPDLADEVLERLAEGKSLTQIAKEVGIPRSTLAHWRDDDREGFAARYARAREEGIHVRFEQMRERAENERDVNRARLNFDMDKWELARMLPKVYGDKVEVSGDVSIDQVDDDKLRSRVADLLRKAGAGPVLGGVGKEGGATPD